MTLPHVSQIFGWLETHAPHLVNPLHQHMQQQYSVSRQGPVDNQTNVFPVDPDAATHYLGPNKGMAPGFHTLPNPPANFRQPTVTVPKNIFHPQGPSYSA